MMKKPTLIKPDGSAATTFNPSQQQCIDLLRQALESAEAGEVHAMVLVAVGPFDYGIAIGGADAPKLYLGCGTAMRTLEQRTSGGGRDTVLRR